MRAPFLMQVLLLTSLDLASLGAAASARPDPTSAESRDVEERWYRLSLQGRDAGWTHEVDAQDIQSSESLLQVERLGTSIELYSRSDVTRDARGRVALEYVATSAPGETLSLHVTFAQDSLLIEHRDREERFARSLLRPADCLDPLAIEARYDLARAHRGEAQRFRCFWPELERIVDVSLSAEGSDTLTLANGAAPICTRFRMEANEAGGMGSTEWRDDDGVTLRAEEDALGLVSELSTREACLAQAEPADVMAQMSIPLSRSFSVSGRYEHVIYRIRSSDGSSLSALRVLPPAKRGPEKDGILTIELPDAAHASKDRDAPSAACLAASPLLQSDSRELIEVAHREAGEGSAWERSVRLCHYVARHVRSKDLSIGFASALATWKSGEGDCTEHAVLLAALARAAGIPSRVKAGLLAFGSEMGFHLWTEVWTGAEWVALDATFDRAPVDGRYLPLSVSDLSAGSVADLAQGILPWIGRVGIEAEVE